MNYYYLATGHAPFAAGKVSCNVACCQCVKFNLSLAKQEYVNLSQWPNDFSVPNKVSFTVGKQLAYKSFVISLCKEKMLTC